MESRHLFEETFTIRSSEVAPDRHITLQSVCNLLQEVAGNHALKLNFDISHLMDQNMTWVLHRLHVVMDRFPKWREDITIKTWPSGGDTLRAYRDFIILDSDGNRIGKSLSYWLILNLETRKPIRIPESILNMAPDDVDHVLDIRRERLSPPEKVNSRKQFKVRRSDLDLNNHVNNVKYIEWALENIPMDKRIYEIDIEFHAECVLGDTIYSEANYLDEEESCHQLRRSREEKTVARAISKYKNH